MNTGCPSFPVEIRFMSSQPIHEVISRYGTQVVRVRCLRRRAVLKREYSLSRLGREYQQQARHNFVQETVILGVITLVAIVWPAIHTVQIIAEAF